MKRLYLGLLYLACVFTAVYERNVFAETRITGICFSAIRDGESPALQIDSLPSTVEKDVAFAARVASTLRTYSVQGSNFLIPEFCDRFEVDCVVGAWIGTSRWQNDAQIEKLIYLAKRKHRSIRSLLVGNEVLHRGDCSLAQLTKYVRTVKAQTDLPVGVAETWRAWHDHPELAKEVDFLGVQAYPYWESLPIEGAAAYTVDRVLEIQRLFPEKKVILSEFGWPTSGGRRGQAEASPENAARYLQEILPLLQQHQIENYYFSLWDEVWKVGPEGGVGGHWGLFKSNGTVKSEFTEFLPSDSIAGIQRRPRSVTFQLAADEYRNVDILRVAYPSEDATSKETVTKDETKSKEFTSPERGPGLQSVKGSGIRIQLPIGQLDSPRSRHEEQGEAKRSEAKRDEAKEDEAKGDEAKGDEAKEDEAKEDPQSERQPARERVRDDEIDRSTGNDGNNGTRTVDSSPAPGPKPVLAAQSLGRVMENPLSPNELFGICLSLFRDNESPHFGITPLISEITEDIAHAGRMARVLRTYTVTDSFGLIHEICENYQIDCVPGAALGKYPWLNESEIEMLIRIGNSGNPRVRALIVGNEVMHRGDFSLEQYIQYIRRVKRSVPVPVATAELLHTWIEHPELADEVDILGVQIYPYWGGLAIESAAEDTLLRVQELQAAHPNKRVMLTEFGWPSDGGTIGGAIASPENAVRYYRETIPLLNRNKVEYFYFAMTDEQWKQGDEGGPGPHWGIMESNGKVKRTFETLLPQKFGMSRPPRKLTLED